MAMSDWSGTASANGTTLGVNIAEGCPPGNVNDAIRKLMADAANAINLDILGTFLSSTSLASARTALGVPSSSTSLTNFGALTNSANKLPYMTGSDNWATTDITSYGRTLLGLGDAGALASSLGLAVTTAGSGTYVTIPIGGVNYKLQFATGSSQSSEGSQSISWPSAFGTTCLFAQVGTKISSGGTSLDSMYQLLGTPGTSSVSVYCQIFDNNGSIIPTVIGFGY